MFEVDVKNVTEGRRRRRRREGPARVWGSDSKMVLKKHSSLIIDRVIDVWSWCKKRDGGEEEEEEEGRTSSGLGFWCSEWHYKARHVKNTPCKKVAFFIFYVFALLFDFGSQKMYG